MDSGDQRPSRIGPEATLTRTIYPWHYGTETWNTNTTARQSQQIFVNKCLRRITLILFPAMISTRYDELCWNWSR